jgi:GAF domain-containing protein
LAKTNTRLKDQEVELRQNQLVLERRITDRTRELERKTSQSNLASIVAQQLADLHDIPTLINNFVQLLAARGGFDHVGLYLSDENQKLFYLQAATSQKGKELISRGYHTATDQPSLINEVLRQNRTFHTSDVSRSVEFRDVNFPSTRSRAVFPMILRGLVFGVLDIQSNRPASFNQDDLDNFASLLRLVAISIENIRLFNDTRTLVEQLSQTATIQTRDTWLKLTEKRPLAYQYTPSGVRPSEPDPSKAQGESAMRVPIRLRGEIIGMITLQRGANSPEWSERERGLVEKISTQTALALDNSRLIEDVQRNAQRDQILAAVSSRIRETLDLDVIMQKAVQEFVRSMNLKEAEVRLGGTEKERPTTGMLTKRPATRSITRPLA